MESFIMIWSNRR